MQWYKIVLTKEMSAIKLHDELQALFLSALGPKDAAIFVHDDMDTGEWVVYLSPGAVLFCKPLIEMYSGVACLAPKKKEVKLSIGYGSAWELLPE